MKTKRILATAMAVTVACSAALSGCGGNSGGNDTSGTGSSSGGGYKIKKYDPPITVTTARYASDDMATKWEDDEYIKWAKDTLGIIWEPKFTATDDANAMEQLMLGAATGDLPDVIPILSPGQVIPLAKQGYLADMNELLEDYASPLLKYVAYDELMEKTENKAFSDVTYDGKIYALPQALDIYNATNNTLIFRKDILDQLGLDMPKSIEDMDKAFAAFKSANPTKYGLFMRGWVMDLPQFWQAFGVSTMQYDIYKIGDSYSYGCIQPGTKQGLAKLREWYQKGYINPSFDTEEDRYQAMVNGKYLSIYLGDWGSQYLYQLAAKSNAGAKFVPMEYLSETSAPTFVQNATPWPSAVSAASKYKEAIMMESSVVAESYLRNDKDLREKFGNMYAETEPKQATNASEVTANGTKYAKYDYAEDQIGPGFFNSATTSVGLLGNVGRITRGQEAGEAYDTFIKNNKNFSNAYNEFTNVQKYIAMTDGDMQYAQSYSLKALESTLLAGKIFSDAYKAGNMKINEVNVNEIDSYSKYTEALTGLTLNTFIGIVKGTKSIDDFDAYVKEFLATGGQTIIDEVNQKYNK